MRIRERTLVVTTLQLALSLSRPNRCIEALIADYSHPHEITVFNVGKRCDQRRTPKSEQRRYKGL